MLDQVLQVAAGVALALAGLCALGAIAVLGTVILRPDPGDHDAAPGLGCAATGLLWALIGWGLYALAQA